MEGDDWIEILQSKSLKQMRDLLMMERLVNLIVKYYNTSDQDKKKIIKDSGRRELFTYYPTKERCMEVINHIFR